MTGKNRSVDGIIKKAIAEGKFDDLEGKGKPLKFNINPYVDEGWKMAYDMLSSQGLTLPWIQKRNVIEEKYLEAIEKVGRTWEWQKEKKEQGEDLVLAKAEWDKAKTGFIEAAKEINQIIDNYNLEIPNDRFYRKRIDADAVIDQLKS